MFSSIVSRLFKSNLQNTNTNAIRPSEQIKTAQTFEDTVLDLNGIFLRDFTLFHHTNTLLIDLLIFLPHYGLYFGEKISWKADDLKNATIELSSKKNKKNASTRLSAIERILHQKLEDVLSFDSTPIERLFWMEHLSEVEFDALHSSFHTLLSKERLIFSDDTAETITKKLFSLSTYQEEPYSDLKVLGSLQAHTLLLPTNEDPFGLFLSDEQKAFLHAPLVKGSITLLNGESATGKSSVFIRKVLHQLLTDPDCKAAIVTPTRLSSDILRKEFIMLCDFAAVALDNARLTFLSPPTPHDAIGMKELPHDASIIVYDDFNHLDSTFMERLHDDIEQKSIFISNLVPTENTIVHSLKNSYRSPAVTTLHFSHAKVAMLDFLIVLQEAFESDILLPILIILPSDEHLGKYKEAIDNHLQIECQLLTSSFSLQYKNLGPIAITTPEYTSGISVPYCYMIDIPAETAEYALCLSRASHCVTVITVDTPSSIL